MTTQFQGESNWDAIINDNGLDIEEEDEFRIFVLKNGESPRLTTLERLESLFEKWEKVRHG